MKTYPKDDIEIVWQSDKCIHSGICARGLKEVFQPRERPWIKADGASKDDIIAQVEKCPSGALSIKTQ